jgi:fatty acyl-CoA reductase
MEPDQTVESILSIPLTQLAAKTPGIIHPFPNTYTYTKNLAERAIRKFRDQIPVLIVRPSIIIASQSEPQPGWLDAMTAAAPLSIMICTGHIDYLVTKDDTRADLIPADHVANTIIVGTFKHMRSAQFKVMHSASSHLNPVTWPEYVHNIMAFARVSPFKNQVGPISF